MKHFKLLVLTIAMLVCSVMGITTLASADNATTTPIKAKVTAYDMSVGSTFGSQFAWQASAEDQYCVLTTSLDLNVGETNNNVIEFTAPIDGVASFADGGAVMHIAQSGGDGVRVRLIHNETQVYPTDARWLSLPTDCSNIVLKPDDFEMKAGDKLYLVFDNGGSFSNGFDSVWYCLGFKLAGNWIGSNEYWYTTEAEGAAEVTCAGVTVAKSDLFKYKYGFVSDSLQGAVMDESSATDTDMEVLVGTTYDGVDRFKGNENEYCQFEKIGMNIMPNIPNIVAMEMSADGVFNVQNSYMKTFNNPANVEVIKNDKVLYTATVGGSYSSIDGMQAVNVTAGDTIYIRFTAGETGAYLRYAVNGVLTTANGVVSYSTVDSVANGGGSVAFYTSKEAADMGGDTSIELKTLDGVDAEQMIYTAGKWTGREQYCLIWKEGTNVYAHTGGTYNPAIAYEFSSAGYAKIANLTMTLGSSMSDGIRYRIIKKTAGEAPVYQQLYPLNEEWVTVVYGQTAEAVDTEMVSVAQGDQLIVVVNLNGTNSLDQTDVKFDVAFQKEGEDVQAYNVSSEFAINNDGAWKYLDVTIPVDYSSRTVGEVVANDYVALEQNRIVLEEMRFFETLNRWGIAGREFLQIESGSLHPNSIYAAAIGIKIPADGRVDMSETTFKYDLHATPDNEGKVSDGVRIRVLRNQDVIYPLNGDWQEIADDENHTYDIPVFEVSKDDMIYVIVDCGESGVESYDLTYVSIVAHFAEDGASWTNTYDSKAAFVESNKNYDAFSYWSYYYDNTPADSSDVNSGDSGTQTPDTGDAPIVDVTPGGCGSSIAVSSFATILVSAFAMFLISKKGRKNQ